MKDSNTSIKESGKSIKDSGESVNDSWESIKDSGKSKNSVKDSGESIIIETQTFSESLSNIMRHKGLSNKKINQRNKFLISKIRKSARQYDKIDRISTRAMKQKEEMNINNTQQHHHNMNNSSRTGKLNKDMSHLKQKSHKEKISTTKKSIISKVFSSKDEMTKLFLFLLTSMGTHSTISNSGGIYVKAIDMTNNQNNDFFDPEYKIDFHDRSFQSSYMDRFRKHNELRDIIEDEDDEDWSFVPKSILDHKKVVRSRHVIKMHQNGDKLKLDLIRNSHIRVKVLWKDGSISWCAGDALQLQKSIFVFTICYQGRPNES